MIYFIYFKEKQVEHRGHRTFHIDVSVPKIFRTKTDYYKQNESHLFDRGHLTPAADYVSDKIDYENSFKLSNIFPQNAHLNRHAWYSCEVLARDLIEYQGLETLYVYSGNGFDFKKGKYNNIYKYITVLNIFYYIAGFLLKTCVWT